MSDGTGVSLGLGVRVGLQFPTQGSVGVILGIEVAGIGDAVGTDVATAGVADGGKAKVGTAVSAIGVGVLGVIRDGVSNDPPVVVFPESVLFEARVGGGDDVPIGVVVVARTVTPPIDFVDVGVLVGDGGGHSRSVSFVAKA